MSVDTLRTRARRIACGAAVLAGLAITACSSSTTTTPSSTTTTTTSATTTELFTGTLSRGGSLFYSFSPVGSGTASATLASVATTRIGPVQPVPLSVGIGIPSAWDCAATTSVIAAPGLTAQVSSAVVAGTYCVRVADVGQLTGDVTFAVRIVHP